MRKTAHKCGVLLTVYCLFVLNALYGGGCLCFFSDTVAGSLAIGTGSLVLSVENLVAEREPGGTAESVPQDGETGVFLAAGVASTFGFSLSNKGASGAFFALSVSAALIGPDGAGELYIYPAYMNDEAIAGDIAENLAASAISGNADTGYLPPSASADYAFKLFYYEDRENPPVPADPAGWPFEITVSASADVSSAATGWAASASRAFRVSADIARPRPLLHETPDMPKTFFVTQATEINLRDYASATDFTGADISDRIEFDAPAALLSGVAGEYSVICSVSDIKGNYAVPLHISFLVWDFVKLASGNYHTLALTSHGKVYAWGYNDYGQLGNGGTAYVQTPALVAGLDNIKDIAAGNSCSYALAASGQAFAWGSNANGRLGDSTTTSRYTPVPVKQPQGTEFVQIAAHFSTAGAIASNGDVYTWGYGGYGAAGTGNGNENRVPTKISVTDAVQLSLGYYNGAAVTRDGSVYTWGDNLHGQLGNGRTMSISTHAPSAVPYFAESDIKIKQVSVGWYHMSAVAEDGRVFTWGYGAEGRLGIDSTADYNTPQEVTSLADAVRTEAAYYSTAVRTSDGTVHFFGQNYYGKHGSGNNTNHLTPYALTSVPGATGFSLAYDSSFVLKEGKEVYGMGYGGTGVLGTGNNSNSSSPVLWAFTPPPPE